MEHKFWDFGCKIATGGVYTPNAKALTLPFSSLFFKKKIIENFELNRKTILKKKKNYIFFNPKVESIIVNKIKPKKIIIIKHVFRNLKEREWREKDESRPYSDSWYNNNTCNIEDLVVVVQMVPVRVENICWLKCLFWGRGP